MDGHPEESARAPFHVTFVTGVTPDKWVRTWQRRETGPLDATPVEQADQLTALRAGRADMGFVRLPVDREGLHVIPLYHEMPVVVVSKEHPVAAYDEIPVSDLADEHLLQDPDDVPAWRAVATELRDGTRYPVPDMSLKVAVESVAAQAGILILPMSVARLHQRKDVVAVPVTGVDPSQVALVWSTKADDPRLETFIGIVRGRTERSSRGVETGTARAPAPTKTGRPSGGRSRPTQRRQSKGRRGRRS